MTMTRTTVYVSLEAKRRLSAPPRNVSTAARQT
jgi:hypothetical protein